MDCIKLDEDLLRETLPKLHKILASLECSRARIRQQRICIENCSIDFSESFHRLLSSMERAEDDIKWHIDTIILLLGCYEDTETKVMNIVAALAVPSIESTAVPIASYKGMGVAHMPYRSVQSQLIYKQSLQHEDWIMGLKEE